MLAAQQKAEEEGMRREKPTMISNFRQVAPEGPALGTGPWPADDNI